MSTDGPVRPHDCPLPEFDSVFRQRSQTDINCVTSCAAFPECRCGGIPEGYYLRHTSDGDKLVPISVRRDRSQPMSADTNWPVQLIASALADDLGLTHARANIAADAVMDRLNIAGWSVMSAGSSQ